MPMNTDTISAASALPDAPINILIVDDEPTNLAVLETILDDPGYRLVRAESADQALLALVAGEFALLILDIRLPGMTGFELAQMIKERKKTAQIPIIFLSAYYREDEHVLEGYGRGAVDYLHKPVNPAILRSKVAVFAALHRLHRESTLASRVLLAEATERRRAEEQLRELNATLELRVAGRTEELRAREEQLRILNRELEARVAGRTSELRATVDALETEMAEGQRLKAEVLRISEEERMRVAADLHDGICQELLGIHLFAHVLRKDLADTHQTLAADAQSIEETLLRTVEHTRQLARGMNPVVADGSGLMDALRQLAGTTADAHRVRCSFYCPAPVLVEDPRTANELYRIAQEAIYNAHRHGQAQHIAVRLSEAGGEACLAVRDNGGGLPADVSRAPGMGLRLMRYRVGVIGGQLHIQPRKRGGTEVICRVAQAPARR